MASKNSVQIDLNKDARKSQLMNKLALLGIKPIGIYTMCDDTEGIEITLPLLVANNVGSGGSTAPDHTETVLFHDIFREQTVAAISNHEKVKAVIKDSSERRQITDVIQNIDFSEGFNFASIVPVVLPMMQSGGVNKKFNFQLTGAFYDDGTSLAVEDGNDTLAVGVSVLGKDLLSEPGIMAKVTKMFTQGSGGKNSTKSKTNPTLGKRF